MDDYRRRLRFRDSYRIREGFAEREQRRAHRQRLQALSEAEQPSLAMIADAELLLAVNQHRKSHGGQAAGPDHVTDQMLGHRETAAIFRDVAAEIRNGSFEPSNKRIVRLPKPKGGFRELAIRSVITRTVAAAIAMILSPRLERVFLDGSHGFRPNRSTWSLLLTMERIVAEQQRFVLATADIRKAFDFVPIAATLELLQQHITDPGLRNPIERLTRGNENRQHGIDQGSALSPLLLNVLLHYVLDKPFSENAANPPWFRYADNLLYLTHSVSEGLAAINQAQKLLEPHGMTLKPEERQVVDLRIGKAEVLGLRLRWDNTQNRLEIGLAKEAWAKLERTLAEAWQYPSPNRRASEALRGWMGYAGIALENQRSPSVVNRIMKTALRYGFSELPRNQIERDVQSSIDRWKAYRARWLRQPIASMAKDDAEAPLTADPPEQQSLPEAEMAVPMWYGNFGCPF